jgi:DNA-binding MurR/RpiR family transcriptional regulator
MSAHPIRTLSHSAEQIAAQTGTSVAAINRFARAAGFEGFSDLKTVLGDELQSAVEPLRKLARSRPKPGSPKAALGDFAIDGEALRRATAEPQIERVAGRLLKARRVWSLGLGTSSYLAGYAAHALTPYLPGVWAIAGDGGTEEAARRLSRCGRGDVLLAVSLPRYSKDTVFLAGFARERRAYVIAITDVAGAPLAAQADALLLAPSGHTTMPSSAVGALAVIEAIASAVMRLSPDAVRRAGELSELVLSYLATSDRASSASHTKEEP